PRGGRHVSRFDAQLDVVRTAMPFRVVGQVQGISGLTIEASDLPLAVGSLCRISSYGAQSSIAEVIGFKHGRTLLMPLSQLAGVSSGDRVLVPPCHRGARFALSEIGELEIGPFSNLQSPIPQSDAGLSQRH